MTIATALRRGILGGVAGAVVCPLVAVVGSHFLYFPNDGPALQDFLPVVSVGGVAGAILNVFAGTWEIRGRAKDAILGVIAGCLVGLLGGVVVAAGLAPEGKFEPAAYLMTGILVGVSAGSILGGICGFAAGAGRRRDDSPPGTDRRSP